MLTRVNEEGGRRPTWSPAQFYRVVTRPKGARLSVGLCMHHDVTGRGFTCNTKAKSFIEFLCPIIDFEYLQSNALGLLVTRCNNRFKQFPPDTLPLVMRMNNDHSYEQLAASILDMGIPDQLVILVRQRNALGIKVSGKIIFLPLFIPSPNFGNETAHYQAIQLVDGFSVCFFSFSKRVSHGDDWYA